LIFLSRFVSIHHWLIEFVCWNLYLIKSKNSKTWFHLFILWMGIPLNTIISTVSAIRKSKWIISSNKASVPTKLSVLRIYVNSRERKIVFFIVTYDVCFLLKSRFKNIPFQLKQRKSKISPSQSLYMQAVKIQYGQCMDK
jgi:hypothetical protein